MTTVMCGEVNVEIENPDDKNIVFRMFLQLFYSRYPYVITLVGILIRIFVCLIFSSFTSLPASAISKRL